MCKALENLEGENINLTCRDVLFGKGLESNAWKKATLVNNVILNVKYFIWHCKKSSINVTIPYFRRWLSSIIEINQSLSQFSAEIENGVY